MLPLAAHINAALAVSQELTADGQEVAWCGPERLLRPLLGPDIPVYPTGMRYYREYAEMGMAAVRVLWDQYLMPANRFILEATRRAAGDYRPDLMVVDQYAMAGALVAHEQGWRWATLCTGLMEL